MILKALVDYYEQLLCEGGGRIAHPGYRSASVKHIIQLSKRGKMILVPSSQKAGRQLYAPEIIPGRTSTAVVPYLLCDKSNYLLGIDPDKTAERLKQCFEASRDFHYRVLDGVDSDCAKAVLAFFDSWDVDNAAANTEVMHIGLKALAKGELTFSVETDDGSTKFAADDPAIQEAWSRYRDKNPSSSVMTCLVTGRREPIARLHPVIKGVYDPSNQKGAQLISFNKEAFESYGHKQGRCAPVSESATHAYGTALNWLLDSPIHHIRLGDTTIVYWSEHHDEQNSRCLSALLGGRGVEMDNNVKAVDQRIDAVMQRIASGGHVDARDIDISAPFYMLGLAPNVTRVSVRFFMRDEFGRVLENVQRHYERIAIAHSPNEREYVTPYWLLKAIENESSKQPVASSELSASLLRAILQGGRYPEALYQNVLLRICASHEVTRERAAIIKAYLLNNRHKTRKEITVELNVERNETAYTLGRAFSLLEQIQEGANGIATITNRYLASACATPAIVFPVLLKLSATHLKKIERDSPGLAGYFSRQLEDVLREENVKMFPKHLSLADQGDFFLGYYHQREARYAKKDAAHEVSGTVNTDDMN